MEKFNTNGRLVPERFLSKLFLIMRITFILIVATTLTTLASVSYSQSARVSLNLRNVTVKDALKAIETKSEFFFIYNNELIDVNRKVNINATDQRIDAVLSTLFAGQDIDIDVIDRKIILAPSDIAAAVQQQRGVSGRITDRTGAPLPGVTVVIKGTTSGTITNANGNYSLSNISEDATLVFSFVGMRTQEVVVGNQSSINVSMVVDAIGIEEVVAVGYGTMKKSDLTGSVSSIKTEELNEQTMTTIEQGIQGKIAGVQVTQTTGAPGGAVSIRIRGANSITAGTEPLYVIDGLPIYSDNNAAEANPGGSNDVGLGGRQVNFGPQQNALSLINPNDIESIEVLKDASATAIYGSRGANGVVLITTKRGKVGRTNIDFDFYTGVQTLAKKLETLSGPEKIALINESRTNDGLDPFIFGEPYNSTTTDWQDEIYRPAPITNYQLSISGGDEKTKFAISGNYFDQKGIIENSGYKRGSARINLDHQIFKYLKIGNSLTLSRSWNNLIDNDGGDRTAVSGGLNYHPYVPVYDNEGDFYWPLDLPNSGDNPINPLHLLNEKEQMLTSNRLLGNVFAEWEIVQNLVLKTSFGVDYLNAERDFFSPSIIDNNIPGIAFGIKSGNSVINTINENTLSFSKELNGHSLNVVAGFTNQAQERNYNQMVSSVFPFETLGANALQIGSTQTISNNETSWYMLSWLGRINYSYKSKYLVTLAARADGSSKFGKSNKWGYFPSGAVAWRISEEPFLQDVESISQLKLRASYGITGNQEIGSYNSLQRLEVLSPVAFNNSVVNGFYPGTPPYEDLRWEKTSMVNIGLDLGLFSGKFTITADYYSKDTEDMLLEKPLPPVAGVGRVTRNMGSMTNTGIEISASAYIINNSNFSWNITGNFTKNTNEITDLAELEEYYPNGYSKLSVGEPIGNFWGKKTDGLYQEGEVHYIDGAQPGDVKYVDLNNDSTINADDNTIIGNALPDFTFGLNNSFSYKNFDLSVYVYGSLGNDVYSPYPTNGNLKKYLDRWTPQNTDTEIPRASNRAASYRSDRSISDASFIRIQNVKLSYNIPVDNLGWLRGAAVYVSAQNLATFTAYEGYDPEVNSFGQNTNLYLGIDNYVYPKARTFTAGVKLNF